LHAAAKGSLAHARCGVDSVAVEAVEGAVLKNHPKIRGHQRDLTYIVEISFAEALVLWKADSIAEQ
jgi:hypothetical protein